MLRTKELQEKLLHLIGWQQNYNTAELRISESLTQSETGLYFQQVHPLLTLETLASIAPDFANIECPEYSDEIVWGKGNIVSYASKKYKALQETQGQIPGESPEYWAETDSFSEWLEFKTKASIQKAINRYYTEKVASKVSTVLCENKILFDGAGRLADTIKNQSKIVGFELIPLRSKGVVTKINKIGLQFTEPGDYTLYLFHSSQEYPIKSVKLTKSQKNSLEWFTVNDWLLPYVGLANDAGGSWYICYVQNELPANSKAINKNRDWSKGPCRGCNPSEYSAWQIWSKYLEVHPFNVSGTSIAKRAYTEVLTDYNKDFSADFAIKTAFGLWDISEMNYRYDTNYGINLDLTVGCDISDFIIEQRNLFQEVIGLQLAVDMLREFAFNPNVRTNRHSINASRVDILYELDGDSSSLKRSGLNYRLDLAYKALSIATEGLDKVCLACKNNGIKYRTI